MTYAKISEIYDISKIYAIIPGKESKGVCSIPDSKYFAGIEFYYNKLYFDKPADDGKLIEVLYSKRDYDGDFIATTEDFNKLILHFNEKYGKYDSRDPNKVGRIALDYVEWIVESGALKIIKLGGHAIDIIFKKSE